MANIKSAEKRIRQPARSAPATGRALAPAHRRQEVPRSSTPRRRAKSLPATYSEIDRALAKGVIHKNAAARYKSRLAKKASAR